MKETFDFSYVYFHLFMFSTFFLLPLLCFFEGGAIIGSQAVLFAFLMMPHAGCLFRQEAFAPLSLDVRQESTYVDFYFAMHEGVGRQLFSW